MSAMSSPSGLYSSIDDAADIEQGNCTGCGAHLRSEMTVCEFCRRQTPYGARRARLARLSQWQGAADLGAWQLWGANTFQKNPFNNIGPAAPLVAPVADTEPDDDYGQSDSALFWFVVALVVFAVTGFAAGVLYPFYM